MCHAKKQNLPEPVHAYFATTRTGAASDSNCDNCVKKGHYARACRRQQRLNNNRTVKKLTEEDVYEPNESLSESDESEWPTTKI